jgi:hypothetical protein
MAQCNYPGWLPEALSSAGNDAMTKRLCQKLKTRLPAGTPDLIIIILPLLLSLQRG